MPTPATPPAVPMLRFALYAEAETQRVLALAHDTEAQSFAADRDGWATLPLRMVWTVPDAGRPMDPTLWTRHQLASEVLRLFFTLEQPTEPHDVAIVMEAAVRWALANQRQDATTAGMVP